MLIVEFEYNEAARFGLDHYIFTLDRPKNEVSIETDFDADVFFGKRIRLEAFKRTWWRR